MNLSFSLIIRGCISIPYNYLISKKLNNTLLQHCSSNLHEAGNVDTLYLVYVTVWLSTILNALLVDALHDEVQLVVNLFCIPADMLGVLGHFQT